MTSRERGAAALVPENRRRIRPHRARGRIDVRLRRVGAINPHEPAPRKNPSGVFRQFPRRAASPSHHFRPPGQYMQQVVHG